MNLNGTDNKRNEHLIITEAMVMCMENPAYYDAKIKKALQVTLTWYSYTPMDKINITVKRGYITIEGMVPWKHQKDLITTLAQRTKGVSGVVNNISVVNEFEMSK